MKDKARTWCESQLVNNPTIESEGHRLPNGGELRRVYSNMAEGMNCEDVRDLLFMFLNNELDEELEEVIDHLARCPECRLALREHMKLSGLLYRTMPYVARTCYSAWN